MGSNKSCSVNFLAILLFSSLITSKQTNNEDISHKKTTKKWENKLTEEHFQMPSQPFEENMAALNILKKLKTSLPENVYQGEYSQIKDFISKTLNIKFGSDEEFEEILSLLSGHGATKSSTIRGLLLFLNFVMILAVLTILVSFIYFFRDWILPFLIKVPIYVRIIQAWVASISLFVYGLTLDPGIQPFVGLISTVAMVGSFWYFILNTYPIDQNNKNMLPHIITFLIFCAGSLIYMSHLIGFASVCHFYFMMGFVCFSFFGGFAFGFQKQDQVTHNLIVSGFMLVFYVSSVLLDLSFRKWSVFETGILFCSTFIYFLALLILETKNWNYVFGANSVLCFVSGFMCFLFGSLSPDLSVFRGVGMTFFTFFLLEKFSLIKWGAYWSLGLFLGGSLVFGYGIILKKYWTYLI